MSESGRCTILACQITVPETRNESDVAVVHHYFTKSAKEWKSRCSRGPVVVNKFQERRDCGPVPKFEETVFDDSAWRFLVDRVPAYSWFDENENLFDGGQRIVAY